MDVVTRSLVLDWACSLGIQDCIDTALDKFNTWKQAEDFEKR